MINIRIAQLRAGLRLSQGELAQRLGVSQNAVSKWERDEAKPSLEMLKKIAAVGNVDVNTLIDEHPDPAGACPNCERLERVIADLRALVDTQKELIALLRK